MRGRRSECAQPSPFVKRPEWEGLDSGREFQVVGESGWFRFTAHVTNERGDEWIDASGGAGKVVMSRSFRLSRIKRRSNGKIVSRPVANRSKSGKAISTIQGEE